MDLNNFRFKFDEKRMTADRRKELLEEFVRRVKDGEGIPPDLLRYIAYGVQQFLDATLAGKTKICCWPTKPGIKNKAGSESVWDQYIWEMQVMFMYKALIEDGRMPREKAVEQVCNRYGIGQTKFYEVLRKTKI